MAIKNGQKVIKINSKRHRGQGINFDKRVTIIAIIIAAIIGVLLAFRPNAYQISIKGEVVGAVKDIKVIQGAKETVITQLKEIYHADVKFEDDLELKKYRAKKRDYIDPTYLISYMRSHMDILIGFKELYVDGVAVGIIASESELEELKLELKKKYYGEREVQVEFGKEVELKDIFAKEEDLISLGKLVQKCTVTTPKTLDYEVQAGDTLSGIANKYNTSVENIVAANESFGDSVVLRIGQKIKVNINEPLLTLNIVQETNSDEKQTEINEEKVNNEEQIN